jgi:hypothetical protein
VKRTRLGRRIHIEAGHELYISEQGAPDIMKISLDDRGRTRITVYNAVGCFEISASREGTLAINNTKFHKSHVEVVWRGKAVVLAALFTIMDALRDSYLATTLAQRLAGYAKVQDMLAQYLGESRAQIKLFGEE